MIDGEGKKENTRADCRRERGKGDNQAGKETDKGWVGLASQFYSTGVTIDSW